MRERTNLMWFLGIDPGKSGGMAILDTFGKPIDSTRMPATERDIFDWIDEDKERITRATIEKVHSMPKQGVKSMFSFGQNYGFLRACLIACKIPFEEVAPGIWMKNLQCNTKGDKNVSKRKAQQLFPGIKGITHCKADALLIAEYGRRKYVQINT